MMIPFVHLVAASFFPMLSAAPSPTPGSQTWYLDSATHSIGPRVMEKTGEQNYRVRIVGGSSKTWLSENPAQGPVTFPDGDWVIYLETDIDWSSKCEVQVGGYDPSTGFYPFTTIESGKSYASGMIMITLSMGASGTVLDGDYLALKVKNNYYDQFVYTNGDSRLISPPSDPGYPLPEIAAGILLFGGLVGLTGHVMFRRRKAAIK